MIFIAAGKFIMGSEEVDREALQQRFGMTRAPYRNEQPQRKVNIDGFYIDKYEVTNKEYKEFTDATGEKPPPDWVNDTYSPSLDAQPVVMVTWYNSDSYCKWKSKRLPTEAEWEKVARGTDGRSFPWGNEFEDKKANALGLTGGTAPVGTFKEDVSPFGVFDMAGNVSEWTQDWYKAYPDSQYLDEAYGETYKVVRGGGWGGIGHYSFDFYYRASFRNYIQPTLYFNDVGFRCAKDT